MDRMEINDSIEGTVIGDNKFVIIPMKNRESVELDKEEYTEFYNLFKKINKVEEAMNILMGSNGNINNVTGDDLFKAMINLINSSDDNMEVIFNFLLYIATENMKDLQDEYNDLIIKAGKGFYDSGISDAKHYCSCEKEEVNENKTTYNSYDKPEVLFDKEAPEFEILGPDEVEEI